MPKRKRIWLIHLCIHSLINLVIILVSMMFFDDFLCVQTQMMTVYDDFFCVQTQMMVAPLRRGKHKHSMEVVSLPQRRRPSLRHQPRHRVDLLWRILQRNTSLSAKWKSLCTLSERRTRCLVRKCCQSGWSMSVQLRRSWWSFDKNIRWDTLAFTFPSFCPLSNCRPGVVLLSLRVLTRATSDYCVVFESCPCRIGVPYHICDSTTSAVVRHLP